ncbi:hypothetical protein T4D_9043 [Trichinella pseudospiralis]|uniref:Uncharacterized protein n=1 Tax=Trichinella pseudospiralis TaxID=6337 RepID=A0A0V1FLY2_TRIPS|nr:hypothetical protein T4D_9043 [Trichinella pseudospiralis]
MYWSQMASSYDGRGGRVVAVTLPVNSQRLPRTTSRPARGLLCGNGSEGVGFITSPFMQAEPPEANRESS